MENKFEYKYKDPNDWSIEDTKSWLHDFKKRSPQLKDVDLTKFEWSGDQLMLYSLEDFQSMSPFGLSLYRNLHSLSKSEWNKSLKNGRNIEEYNISKDLIEREIVDRTVLIRIGTKNTFISLGCGVRIGSSLILTSKHVVHHADFPQDKVLFNIGVSKPMKWVSAKLLEMTTENDDFDLALLEIYDEESVFDHILDSSKSKQTNSPNKRLSSNEPSSSSSSSSSNSNIKQQHDHKENADGFYEKNHVVNSSEYTKPNYDYQHLDDNEKEKQKQDFEKVISINSISFHDINEGILCKDIILCGFPKERIPKVLISDFKINVPPVTPSIEKGYVSFSDERLIEVQSVPEPGYSESSVIFSTSDARLVGIVKSQYITNPYKYYVTPGIQIKNWLNTTLRKHNINNLSF
ncbi:hypothetical protein DICPUDRAFT_97465 [Dictyostelium purpureum]|uniref:PNT domain-containing protein n=1 Tax=Dictyostelium purpureum TaxID=5786 RepID=F0ZGY1_DICPU|nr:uncharacterized protein DICPUDRAFT_97465 [Dictyostelium purpureum]EGC36792.1 hypothetical protein DICPUDRAFT_97465 [Dictyostelium purpureum]|eukprot:XP_003286663.1 hypothetical protein DICPUDRAFT_97465 [Dictyostelium purpureum]